MNRDPSPILNHIFVDFENVQKIDATIIGGDQVRFTLLAGSLNKKVDLAVVAQFLKHPANVKLVQLTSSGRNALDFTLAYYIGRAAVGDPRGRFHIVSKDKGFDPLVEHLQSKGLQAFRHDSFTTLDLTRAPKAKSSPPKPSPPKAKPKTGAKTVIPRLDDLAAKTLDHLRNAKTKPPKNKPKLASHLLTHFGRKITATEVPALIEHLRNNGHLAIDEKGVVTYDLKQAAQR